MALGRRTVGTRRAGALHERALPLDLRLKRDDRSLPVDDGARVRRGSGASTPARRRKHRRRRHNGGGRGRAGRSPLRRLTYWSAVAAAWLVIVGIGGFAWIATTLPPIQELGIPQRPPSIEIVGLDGSALITRGEMGGAAVPLRELPAFVPKAFIAIEDRRFYSHIGIDPIGVLRAAATNVLRRGVTQGGSTITQQLAKNLFLTPERTLRRKLQELVLALWLEYEFSKEHILDLYLNRIYFGAGAYGVEAAAQRYFGRSARQLTLAEAAMLAGLVQSPSRLAPNRNPDGAARRARVVLSAMAELGFVNEAMFKAADAHPARVVKPPGAGSINYVADWIMDVLDDLVGHVEQDLVVQTSIDPKLQAAAETALVSALEAQGAKFNVGQGALVAMTPDGAVRAMIGGRDYADSQFNRATAAKRQPGSAFKPFVYLTAIERGLNPDTVREDGPISVKGWRPENYSREYYGPVTLTQGLALSLNTVSVRLTQEFGPVAVARTAYRLGIASPLEANPSLALGTSEVSLLELTTAYTPFANGGIAIAPHVVERVRTRDGKTLYVHASQGLGRIVEPRAITMMNAMMRETLLIGTARKAELPGWPAAGKTGTSQDFRDAWFIGYTAHLVAGVWLGNDDASPTRKATGGGIPAEIWRQFMARAHQGVPVAGLPGMRGIAPADGLTPPIEVAAAQPGAAPAPRPTGGLDSWLLDRLLGRR